MSAAVQLTPKQRRAIRGAIEGVCISRAKEEAATRGDYETDSYFSGYYQAISDVRDALKEQDGVYVTCWGS